MRSTVFARSVLSILLAILIATVMLLNSSAKSAFETKSSSSSQRDDADTTFLDLESGGQKKKMDNKDKYKFDVKLGKHGNADKIERIFCINLHDQLYNSIGNNSNVNVAGDYTIKNLYTNDAHRKDRFLIQMIVARGDGQKQVVTTKTYFEDFHGEIIKLDGTTSWSTVVKNDGKKLNPLNLNNNIKREDKITIQNMNLTAASGTTGGMLTYAVMIDIDTYDVIQVSMTNCGPTNWNVTYRGATNGHNYMLHVFDDTGADDIRFYP